MKPWPPALVTYRARMGSIFSQALSVVLVGPRGKKTWWRWRCSTRRSSALIILIPSSWTETEGTNYAWLNIRGNICHYMSHKLGVLIIYKRKLLVLRGAGSHTRVDTNTITRSLSLQQQHNNVEMVIVSKNSLN